VTLARELVIDLAIVLGCVFDRPRAALATLIAGGLACGGAERLLGRCRREVRGG